MSLQIVSCSIRTCIRALIATAAFAGVATSAHGQFVQYYRNDQNAFGHMNATMEPNSEWFSSKILTRGVFTSGAPVSLLEDFDIVALDPVALAAIAAPGEQFHQTLARYFELNPHADGVFYIGSTCPPKPGLFCGVTGIELNFSPPGRLYADVCNAPTGVPFDLWTFRDSLDTFVGVRYLGQQHSFYLSVRVNAPADWLESPTGHGFVELSQGLSDRLALGLYSRNFRPWDFAQIKDESFTPYTDEITWPLTRLQYNSAVRHIRQVQQDIALGKVSYELLGMNCVQFAADVAGAAGVEMPAYSNGVCASPRQLAESIRHAVLTNGGCHGAQKPRGQCTTSQTPWLQGGDGRFFGDPDWFLHHVIENPDQAASAMLSKAMHWTAADTTVGVDMPLNLSIADAYPSSEMHVIDFGDGSAPVLSRAADHTFTTAGTYGARVIVIDPAGVHVIRFNVLVTPRGGAHTVDVAVPLMPPLNPQLNPGEPAVVPPFARTFPADPTCDWVANGEDLAMVLAAWGSTEPTIADIDDDGVVSGNDLAIVLAGWGATGN